MKDPEMFSPPIFRTAIHPLSRPLDATTGFASVTIPCRLVAASPGSTRAVASGSYHPGHPNPPDAVVHEGKDRARAPETEALGKPKDISDAIEDEENHLRCLGFIIGINNLWAPDFGGWKHDEEKVEKYPHNTQYLAALQIVRRLYTSDDSVWAHLAAETQTGKTGVVTTVARMLLANYNRVLISPDGVFVLTGMSDNEWKRQTKERLPRILRERVHHSTTLNFVATALREKAQREGGLRNVIVFLDESHIASAKNNQPATIFQTLEDLCPVERWKEANVRMVTISATDPALIITSAHFCKYSTVVHLLSSPEYLGIQKLRDTGRLRRAEELRDEASVHSFINDISRDHGLGTRLYHIIRLGQGKHHIVRSALEKLVPGCHVVQWDSQKKGDAGYEDPKSMDINERLLSREPVSPTFVLIKNMFYASKTLDDRFIGSLHDRPSKQDDTAIQGLAGRACGYGKSDRTRVYTNMEAMDNYLRLWLRIAPTEKIIVPPGMSSRTITGKMRGVATRLDEEQRVVLCVNHSRSTPMGTEHAVPSPPTNPVLALEKEGKNKRNPLRPRVELDKNEWYVYDTEDEVIAKWKECVPRPGKKPDLKRDQEGFKVCTISNNKVRQRLRVEEIECLRATTLANSSTSMLHIPEDPVPGRCYVRRYVGYADTDDPRTARYYLHVARVKS